MKILILSNNANGLYNFRFELIEALISKGFIVFFSLPEAKDDKFVKLIEEVGAKHIQTKFNSRGLNPFKDIYLLKEYKRIIKRLDPDLLLTYTIKPNIYGTYAANKYKKPVFINITGIGSSLTYSKLKFIIIKLYRRACIKARLVFFQNDSNRDFFITNKMVDENNTILLPGSGVNINKFYPLKKENMDKKIKFLFIGRLMKEKGIDEYLKAANIVTKTYKNVEFQIIGSYEEKKYKEILLKNQNKMITYLGVSDDVRNEIKEVDCIINASYHEGMSNILLEGAAMEKSLIAPNIPGCKEIIDEGVNGYLFKEKSVLSLQEKIIKFIELSDESRMLMGESSRKKVVAKFKREYIIDEYLKAIKTFD